MVCLRSQRRFHRAGTLLPARRPTARATALAGNTVAKTEKSGAQVRGLNYFLRTQQLLKVEKALFEPCRVGRGLSSAETIDLVFVDNQDLSACQQQARQ